MVCDGQVLELPQGFDKLYILGASTKGDKKVTFLVDDKPVELSMQDYKENVGSWDMMVNGAGCLIKRDEIAVAYTHTHNAEGDRLYLFSCLFKYALDIAGAKTVTLPLDSEILVMGATVAETGNQDAKPLAPLYDAIEVAVTEKYHLTVEGASGSGDYPEGKLVLVCTSAYDDGKIMDGWEGKRSVQ